MQAYIDSKYDSMLCYWATSFKSIHHMWKLEIQKVSQHQKRGGSLFLDGLSHRTLAPSNRTHARIMVTQFGVLLYM